MFKIRTDHWLYTEEISPNTHLHFRYLMPQGPPGHSPDTQLEVTITLAYYLQGQALESGAMQGKIQVKMETRAYKLTLLLFSLTMQNSGGRGVLTCPDILEDLRIMQMGICWFIFYLKHSLKRIILQTD